MQPDSFVKTGALVNPTARQAAAVFIVVALSQRTLATNVSNQTSIT